MATTSGRPLLTLPAETRLLIYQHYIDGLTAYLIKSVDEDETGNSDQGLIRVRFKTTLGSYDEPNCRIALAGVCKVIRSEALPFIAANLPLQLIAVKDLPMVHGDMSVLPDWYAVRVKTVIFYDEEVSRYCLLPLPSLEEVMLAGFSVGPLHGFDQDTPRTKAELESRALRERVRNISDDIHNILKEHLAPYIQKPDFQLIIMLMYAKFCAVTPNGDLVRGASLVSLQVYF